MTGFLDHAVESGHRVFTDITEPWRCLDCEARSVMWDMTADPCGGDTKGGTGCVCDPPFTNGTVEDGRAWFRQLLIDHGFDPDRELTAAERLDLDVLLYGSCYIEVTPTGNRRIDPLNIIIRTRQEPA